jgi:pimeloyl-ACP methyl ester carboxylesterase
MLCRRATLTRRLEAEMHVRIIAVLAILFGLTGGAYADEVIDGSLGPGALYRMVRPTNWNGTLLLYAHGFLPASEPVSLPSDGDLMVSLLVPQGFAVAFSSFSENGWAVKDGAQRTKQLLGIFTSKFGAPSRIYLGGVSMGGLIAIQLAEEHPNRFDGMLLGCPVSGGTRAQTDYLANVRALFDLFYPNAMLPGDASGVPAGVDPTTQIVVPAVAAMQVNPTGASVIAAVAQTPVPWSNTTELGQSIVTALLGHASTAPDQSPQLRGQPYFDNRGVLALINATIDRFDAMPSVLNYQAHHYQPTGGLEIPTMTLSLSLDPVAPGFHRTLYANLVASAGNSDHLVQRTVNRYGHCDQLTPVEIATAFKDLVAWVEFGIKPAP